ncbi:hypothetical protein ACQSEM_12875 [Salmonella enterica]|uniref:hypothetical protein n=1 Tax=Salmonella enterica TaxID=28901 RepID=UPI003D31CF8D
MKSKKTPLGEFLDDRQMKPLELMTPEEYKFHLECDHFLMVDGHGFLVDDFTGRHFAKNREQLDLFIFHLMTLREEMY